jgi:magnesium-transporting ATPase (P-type)
LEALGSLDKRDEKMEALQDEIETGLFLVAATAIEDKLQDEVSREIEERL